MSAGPGPLRGLVLRILRVPPEPAPPAGSPGSLRIFRAGRNYFRLRRGLWVLRQVSVLAVFLVWIAGMHGLLPGEIRTTGGRVVDFGAARDWILVAELAGLVLALAQVPFTYVLVALDYEMRWYMVTDRSLRIREGLTRIREMTVSFANIQNISVRQGPLQRLLGLHDLVVTTAGGGGAAAHGAGQQGLGAAESFHTGVLRGVDNAAEIRDLMLAHQRSLRDSGLGDPDEPPAPIPGGGPDAGGESSLAAARGVLAEARALRAALRNPGTDPAP